MKKIKLNVKHVFSKVSIASYENNTPTKEPTPIPTEGPGKVICGINTPIPTSECPTERKDLNLPNCFKAAYGELCEGDGECDDTIDVLSNCDEYDIYMNSQYTPSPTISPTVFPTVSPTQAVGIGKCGINTPISTSECPTERKDLNLPNCFKASYGELCEGDGECDDTIDLLNNCDEYDIYVKTEYDGKVNCGKLLRVSKKIVVKRRPLKR